MEETKNMLSVLMDGIKDTGMIIEYAKSASDPEWIEWFKVRANKRLELLDTDYDYVVKAIDLEEKVKAGDVIADALCTHLKNEMNALAYNFNSL